eukprot:4530575-Pleurochrysis_carterae.AAC.1
MSEEAGDTSPSSESRSADAAEAAECSAAAAATASLGARLNWRERAAAGIAPNEKCAASAARKSGRCVVGRTKDSTLRTARCRWSCVDVPDSAARVHHTNRMPFRSKRWRCEGVRATWFRSTGSGTGAAAILGPP